MQMSGTATLLPCPFCGGEAEITDSGIADNWVICKSCYAANAAPQKWLAIKGWNDRTSRRPVGRGKHHTTCPDCKHMEASHENTDGNGCVGNLPGLQRCGCMAKPGRTAKFIAEIRSARKITAEDLNTVIT